MDIHRAEKLPRMETVGALASDLGHLGLLATETSALGSAPPSVAIPTKRSVGRTRKVNTIASPPTPWNFDNTNDHSPSVNCPRCNRALVAHRFAQHLGRCPGWSARQSGIPEGPNNALERGEPKRKRCQAGDDEDGKKNKVLTKEAKSGMEE